MSGPPPDDSFPTPGEVPPKPGEDKPGQIETDKEARTMGMLAHLLGIFTSFVGPLVIWLIKKDESEFVDDQAKESLNFQLTLFIAHLVSGALWCVFVGMLTTSALVVVQIVFCIMGAMKANDGEYYRYPINIRIIT